MTLAGGQFQLNLTFFFRKLSLCAKSKLYKKAAYGESRTVFDIIFSLYALQVK